MNPTCGTDCDSELAPVSFSLCSPEFFLSEIQRVFLAKPNAADFDDIEDPAEWITRLSYTSVVGDDYIRALTVIGDKPEPTTTERPVSGGRTEVVNKVHILNFTVDEANQINHDFLRLLECGGKYKMWYETSGGLIMGGNSGIKVYVKGNMVLARGQEEVMVYNFVATWKDKFTEERGVSPIFAAA